MECRDRLAVGVVLQIGWHAAASRPAVSRQPWLRAAAGSFRRQAVHRAPRQALLHPIVVELAEVSIEGTILFDHEEDVLQALDTRSAAHGEAAVVAAHGGGG